MASDGEDDGSRIETSRLMLRRPKIEDAAEIAALADDWAVASNLARLPYPYGPADARDWIDAVGDGGAESAFVITCARTGTVMGTCGVGPATWTPGVQIGYWLGVAHWGRGYATEAARAMVDLAFGEPSLQHLWCSCRVTNDASRRVIHKCGFQFHGADMAHMRTAGVCVPVEHYCLDRPVWLALGTWKAA